MCAILICAFELSFSFFSWWTQVDFVPGLFFDTFTGLGDFEFLEQYHTSYKRLEWDTPAPLVTLMALVVQLVFYVVTVVVLMNLLIAIMSQTYIENYNIAS